MTALVEPTTGGEAVRRQRPARPLRRCIASGQVRPKEALIRFVAAPDGAVVPDLAQRLPGRGLWLTCDSDIITRACSRNLFAKAARAPLRPAQDLADQVERLLVRRCLDLLGLARRSGQAVGGFDKAAAWLTEGAAVALLQACDAADGGRQKLRALARTRAIPVAEVLTAAQLGAAWSREAIVHVAVAGGTGHRLYGEITRLSALRGRPLPGAPGTAENDDQA